jgi:hypothetical protein
MGVSLRLLNPLGLARGGAKALVGALKVGSSALGGLAEVVELFTGSQANHTYPPATPESFPPAARFPPAAEPATADASLFEGTLAEQALDALQVGPPPPVAPRPAPRSPRARPLAPPLTQAPALAELPPRHLQEEPVLVAESADRGAENGAGAQIHITEPWSGYHLLKAPEVIDRLVVEAAGVLSLVLLYERSNRARRTVLAAAERELERRSSQ